MSVTGRTAGRGRGERGSGAGPVAGKREPVVTLKPVGISEDGRELLLARRANARGSFRVRIDGSLAEQLVAARDRVEGAVRNAQAPPPLKPTPAEPLAPPVESKLSVREIQNLLRRGKSIASIARRAGVEPAWIERWAGPIRWERAGMVERARRATMARPRRGASAEPLGASVEANLRRRGVALDPDAWAAAWDSVREPRGPAWTVSFTVTNRGRTRIAQWRFDPDAERVAAKNDLGADLGWIEPKRRRRAG